MPSIEVRPFERRDREQLTALVNRHVGAVLPGVAVSVNTVMSQLEREPNEAIVDPWVIERRTLVCFARQAIVAGAHLLRYGAEEPVGDYYRDVGEIHWLVCDPSEPMAGERLMTQCMQIMDGWGVTRQYAEGELPSLATYGVPACWPHIRELYARSGFVHRGRVELILVANVYELPKAIEPPQRGASLQRSVGDCGMRFSAVLDDEVLGYIEVDTDTTHAGTRAMYRRWSDIGNFHVSHDRRGQGIATWLLAAAADWLRLGSIERVLAYVWPNELEMHAFLTHHGFRELTRTERGWQRST